MEMNRAGVGYDAHRLAEGRRLILGGVEIPFERGLLGHSDADVLLHALIDALLGAAALPDIGQQFPDTNELWRGADSVLLLRWTRELLAHAGWQVVNVSAAVVAQAPRLSPYIGQMRANIAQALQIDVSCVGLSAKTEEGMGFTGAGEGMAAHAVCMIANNSQD